MILVDIMVKYLIPFSCIASKENSRAEKKKPSRDKRPEFNPKKSEFYFNNAFNGWGSRP